MVTHIVSKGESGKKLHRLLRHLLPNMPLGRLYKLIDKGLVRVNGKRKKKDYAVAEGDVLTFLMAEEEFRQAASGPRKRKFVGVPADLDVVYEDDTLLVVNKPPGLLVHPDRTEFKNTLISRVHAYLYRKGELDSRVFLPAAAGRLDRNTSGLVLIGKTAGMLHQLNRWHQERAIGKVYLTVVEGTPPAEGEIRRALVRDPDANRTRVASGGKEAVTRYRVLDARGGYALVEVELVSGRTHQIRAHFQSIGHPLLGDVKYGGRPAFGVNHQLLHAWRVALPDGRAFVAPLPDRFARVVQAIGLRVPEEEGTR